MYLFITLFIYIVFNNTVSSSGYTASTIKELVNKQL